MTEDIQLSSIFKEVTKVLKENCQDLNDADDYNHNHGSNMVNTFSLLQKAVKSVKDKPVAEQLEHASKTLRAQSTSGSAQLYADGLERASHEFVGKELNDSTAGTLVNAMMGMGGSSERGGSDFLSALLGNLTKPKEESAPAPEQPDNLLGSLVGSLTGQQQTQPQAQQPGGDLLGSLLGGLGGQQESTPQAQQPGGDLLGSLLGGLTGQQQQAPKPAAGGGIADLLTSLVGGQSGSSQGQSNGIDAKDLISLGLAYYAAKQKGGSNLEAIMQALATASPFGKRRDQTQSGALVVNTIMQMLGSR